jgi:hypothetical protein
MSEIYISEAFKGAMTPHDLLQSFGGMSFVFFKSQITQEGIIFKVIDENYKLVAEFLDGKISFSRNNFKSEVKLSDLPSDKIRLWFEWYNDFIVLVARYGPNDGELEYEITDTPPTKVPSELIQAARKQNLIESSLYQNTTIFWNRIITCLSSIQHKLDISKVQQLFWNIQKDENGKTIYKPKRETEIHPIIHSLLIDQSIIHSFDISPEFHSGVGNLDFLISGNLSNGKRCKVCIEFKNAHSPDLESGFLYQLPAYMKNMEVDHGIYGVFNFKGQWFDENPDVRTMQHNILEKAKEIKDPCYEGIRSIYLNLSKPVTASKIKNYR